MEGGTGPRGARDDGGGRRDPRRSCADRRRITLRAGRGCGRRAGRGDLRRRRQRRWWHDDGHRRHLLRLGPRARHLSRALLGLPTRPDVGVLVVSGDRPLGHRDRDRREGRPGHTARRRHDAAGRGRGRHRAQLGRRPRRWDLGLGERDAGFRVDRYADRDRRHLPHRAAAVRRLQGAVRRSGLAAGVRAGVLERRADVERRRDVAPGSGRRFPPRWGRRGAVGRGHRRRHGDRRGRYAAARHLRERAGAPHRRRAGLDQRHADRERRDVLAHRSAARHGARAVPGLRVGDLRGAVVLGGGHQR